MYRVYVKNMNGEYPIYEPLDDTLRIFEPVLTQEMGGAGSFTFQIYEGHPYYKQLKVLTSEVIVMMMTKGYSMAGCGGRNRALTI
jgi:hypothetical protein